MKNPKLFPLSITSLVLASTISLHAFAEGNYPSYPNKEMAEKFLEQNCNGFVNKFKVNAEKRPKLLNSCLLFSIVTGDRDNINTFLEKGANPMARWPQEPGNGGKKPSDAIWPNAKGEILDETDSGARIGASIGSIFLSSMRQAYREAGQEEEVSGLSPDGLGFNALTLAISLNDLTTVDALLKKEAKLESMDSFYRIPLAHAISMGNEKIIARLLQEKENCLNCYPNIPFKSHPAQIAQFLKNTEGQSILGKNTEATWLNPESNGPLSMAVLKGNYAVAKMLLNKGANPSSVLNKAFKENNIALIDNLSNGASKEVLNTLFDDLVSAGFMEGIKPLEKNGFVLDATKVKLLLTATSSSAFQMGQALAKDQKISDADIFDILYQRAEENTGAIRSAQSEYWRSRNYRSIFKNEIETRVNLQFVVERLVDMANKKSLSVEQQLKLINLAKESGIDTMEDSILSAKLSTEILKSQQLKSLALKSSTGKMKYFDALLAAGLTSEAIAFANENNLLKTNKEAINKILAAKPSKELLQDSGLLHVALAGGIDKKENREMVNQLIALGVDANSKNKQGESALELVIRGTSDGDAFLQSMIEQGMCPNISTQDNMGMSELAASLGKIKHALFLGELDESAGASSMQKTLFTLLKNNSVSGDSALEAVEHFLKQGYKIDTKNKNGETLLMLAAQRCDSGLVDALIQKGANARLKNADFIPAADYAFENLASKANSGMNCSDLKKVQARCEETIRVLTSNGSSLMGSSYQMSCYR